MLVFKIAGTLFVLASGACLALGAARFERCRLQVYDGLISLIFFIKGRIDCYAMPVDEIMRTMDKGILADCRCPGQVESVEQLLLHAQPYLTAQTRRVLQGFAQGLGGGFRDEQIKRCDYYIELLRAERMQLETEVPARARASGALWILCAVGAVILLW